MTFKALLLGTAAAVVATTGVQAADLTVAEPVDYVKVCDAFGKGYFYSPGTDTCIKIGGYVKFFTKIGEDSKGLGLNDYFTPRGDWAFITETSLQVTASSATEYGNLTGFIDYRAKSDNSGNDRNAYIDSAYLQLGGLKAGRFTSLFDFGRGYTDTGAFGSDSKTDHIQYTAALTDEIAFGVSLEDSRDRGASVNQDNIPDVVAALTWASGGISSKFAATYVNHAYDTVTSERESGWAVGGGLEFGLDQIAKGDKFFVSATYADNAASFTGLSGGTSLGYKAADTLGWSWSALASFKHVWSPEVWSAVSAGYLDSEAKGDAWRGVFSTGYTPVKGLDLMADFTYTTGDAVNSVDKDNFWLVNLWLKRSW